MHDEQIAQRVEDIAGVQLALDADGEAFASELINDAQHAERFAVMGSVHHEVVAPHMISMLRPQAHARAVIQP